MNFQRSVTYSTNFNLLILLLVIIIVHELRRCSLRRYKIRIHRTQERFRYGVSGINTIPSTTNIYIYIYTLSFHFLSLPSVHFLPSFYHFPISCRRPNYRQGRGIVVMDHGDNAFTAQPSNRRDMSIHRHGRDEEKIQR